MHLQSSMREMQDEWASLCELAFVLFESKQPELLDLANLLMDYRAHVFECYGLQDTYEPASELCSDQLQTLALFSHEAFLRRFKAFREWWIETATVLIDECFASIDRIPFELSLQALRSIVYCIDMLHEVRTHTLLFDAFETVWESYHDAMLAGAVLVVVMTATIEIVSAELYPLLTIIGYSQNESLRQLFAWVVSWNISQITSTSFRQSEGLQKMLSVVYGGAKEALEKGNIYKVLAKEFRLSLNPSGTGKNPEYEHEIAESRLDLPEDTPSPLETAIGNEPDPADVVEEKDEVEQTLARFGKRTAELLRLMVTEGMTTAEAARVLGMNESTARKLLERARKQFSKNP